MQVLAQPRANSALWLLHVGATPECLRHVHARPFHAGNGLRVCSSHQSQTQPAGCRSPWNGGPYGGDPSEMTKDLLRLLWTMLGALTGGAIGIYAMLRTFEYYDDLVSQGGMLPVVMVLLFVGGGLLGGGYAVLAILMRREKALQRKKDAEKKKKRYGRKKKR